MIVESLDEYLETLAGYIYDNDKLVTYKWLSKELEVHVNVSKQILWEFTQRHKEEDDLEKTFLLMGTLKDGGMRVEVVKEANLSIAKAKYNKISAEHVYSLQKALPDIELLAISGEGDVKYGAIKCKESTERSNEEMHALRWGSSAKYQAPIQTEEKVKPMEVESSNAETNQKKKNVDENKGSTAQKHGFNNLFGKASSKQKSPPSKSNNTGKTETSSTTKHTSPKKNASPSSKKKVQKGALDGFLGQSKTQGKSANVISMETKNSKEQSYVEEKNNVNGKVVESHSKTKPKKDTRGKKRNRSKDTNVAAKKRKRITIQSDSSDTGSSNEGEGEGEQEPEPPSSPQPVSPPKARSPSPPKVKHEGGKRKVLKMVDKTFEEDGYLVTKKVHVYESCSEEEPEPVEVKKPEVKVDPKSKKSTKQTTLMNFFKKS